MVVIDIYIQLRFTSDSRRTLQYPISFWKSCYNFGGYLNHGYPKGIPNHPKSTFLVTGPIDQLICRQDNPGFLWTIEIPSQYFGARNIQAGWRRRMTTLAVGGHRGPMVKAVKAENEMKYTCWVGYTKAISRRAQLDQKTVFDGQWLNHHVWWWNCLFLLVQSFNLTG